MTDYSETEESAVSDESQRGEDLFEAVEETVSEWVDDDTIPVERRGRKIVVDEDELVKSISVMVAIAMDEVRE